MLQTTLTTYDLLLLLLFSPPLLQYKLPVHPVNTAPCSPSITHSHKENTTVILQASVDQTNADV